MKDYNKFKASLDSMKEQCIKTRQYSDGKNHKDQNQNSASTKD